MAEIEHPKSVGHQHVLAPEMRTIDRAWSVAHKLLHKAAIRLRSGDLWASRISMAASFLPEELGESDTRPNGLADSTPNSAASSKMSGRFGWSNGPNNPKGPSNRRGWSAELKLSECQDSDTLIHALKKLWDSRPRGPEYARPYFIGVQLSELVPSPLHSLGLFSELDNDQRRANLSAAMDALNGRYGMATVAPAAMLTAITERAAPTRIAFHTIPEMFE